ncbi:hypothetical protein OBBRIDRAFT_807378 [Obba rivulosa]|uniref:Uncharacterized protein n=1 Tax=Obba rivulosa TaxID=1052685 RepID=A0A8E2DG56_9APHY|nr:hypothetical protein OBBRIDRAFT_807378 [Obba rivulosa]
MFEDNLLKATHTAAAARQNIVKPQRGVRLDAKGKPVADSKANASKAKAITSAKTNAKMMIIDDASSPLSDISSDSGDEYMNVATTEEVGTVEPSGDDVSEVELLGKKKKGEKLSVRKRIELFHQVVPEVEPADTELTLRPGNPYEARSKTAAPVGNEHSSPQIIKNFVAKLNQAAWNASSAAAMEDTSDSYTKVSNKKMKSAVHTKAASTTWKRQVTIVEPTLPARGNSKPKGKPHEANSLATFNIPVSVLANSHTPPRPIAEAFPLFNSKDECRASAPTATADNLGAKARSKHATTFTASICSASTAIVPATTVTTGSSQKLPGTAAATIVPKGWVSKEKNALADIDKGDKPDVVNENENGDKGKGKGVQGALPILKPTAFKLHQNHNDPFDLDEEGKARVTKAAMISVQIKNEEDNGLPFDNHDSWLGVHQESQNPSAWLDDYYTNLKADDLPRDDGPATQVDKDAIDISDDDDDEEVNDTAAFGHSIFAEDDMHVDLEMMKKKRPSTSDLPKEVKLIWKCFVPIYDKWIRLQPNPFDIQDFDAILAVQKIYNYLLDDEYPHEIHAEDVIYVLMTLVEVFFSLTEDNRDFSDMNNQINFTYEMLMHGIFLYQKVEGNDQHLAYHAFHIYKIGHHTEYTPFRNPTMQKALNADLYFSGKNYETWLLSFSQRLQGLSAPKW